MNLVDAGEKETSSLLLNKTRSGKQHIAKRIGQKSMLTFENIIKRILKKPLLGQQHGIKGTQKS
ncbi:MAG: hypothetical protein DRP42_03690 [Tenericutes bacterium]|nr:MAG: hypothetical protein DRP42_03690 [Mycoplasmatota bacterium]